MTGGADFDFTTGAEIAAVDDQCVGAFEKVEHGIFKGHQTRQRWNFETWKRKKIQREAMPHHLR